MKPSRDAALAALVVVGMGLMATVGIIVAAVIWAWQ